jgi:type IV pilus assembly protein PilB
MLKPRELGELLVRSHLLDYYHLDAALRTLSERNMPPKRLIDVLIDRGFIDEYALPAWLARELSVPKVSVSSMEPPRSLLALIPKCTAERFCAVPVYILRERSRVPTLCVAMHDPSWDEALYTFAVVAGMPIRAVVASRSEIREAVLTWYAPSKTTQNERPTVPLRKLDTDRRSTLPPVL